MLAGGTFRWRIQGNLLRHKVVVEAELSLRIYNLRNTIVKGYNTGSERSAKVLGRDVESKRIDITSVLWQERQKLEKNGRCVSK